MASPYKDTLHLPRTGFPMRGNLPQREPAQIKAWAKSEIYHKMVEARSGDVFLFHDGPPYANGNIHLGTALNKVLKDIVIKYQNLAGRRAEFVPGWDCHGLPIELQVQKATGEQKEALDPVTVRRASRKHADRFQRIQAKEFARLGVLADFQSPYKTMNPPYQATIVRELAKLVRTGAVYRGRKPVYWCTSCRTALADAEVEYGDHESPSIYVRFDLCEDARERLPDAVPADEPVYVVIWTTTPWTIPANLAVAFRADAPYVVARFEPRGELLIVAKELLEAFVESAGLASPQIVAELSGRDLDGAHAKHPFVDRESLFVLADHVTMEDGTGCVHTAPGHGRDDFEVGNAHGLEPYAPLDDSGAFTDEFEAFEGVSVFEANPGIVSLLEERGALVHQSSVSHSYPHCWRCHEPVIFRATGQWFVDIDKTNIRGTALDAVEEVKWVPPWGRDRIRGMLESRPDWCISRQRFWGVPIVAFRCDDCGHYLIDAELIDHVASLVEQHSADVWYVREAGDLLPNGTSCPECSGSALSKCTDILDVWFDSGVSFAADLEQRKGSEAITDLYLEGSDQHRGWFQSSLLVSVGTRGRPPFKTVLTHGFVVTADGHKMAKSRGNAIAPEELTQRYGAEVLRLWVANEDFRDDIRVGEEILERVAENYRKIRNTLRFILGSLDGFDPEAWPEERVELDLLDRYVLRQLDRYLERAREAYESYTFHSIMHRTMELMVTDLSSLYLDVRKDRLYCDATDDPLRRGTQFVLERLGRAVVTALAPILSFTMEEAYAHLPRRPGDPESVFLTDFPEPCAAGDEQADELAPLLELRDAVLKQIEAERSEGRIRSSLQASARIVVPEKHPAASMLAALPEGFLSDLLIVSDAQVEVSSGAEAVSATVGLAPGHKCARCWKIGEDTASSPEHPDLCPRCAKVVAA